MKEMMMTMTLQANNKEFKTKAEYAAVMKDAKTTVYKNYIKL